jgi:hypothetical protein
MLPAARPQEGDAAMIFRILRHAAWPALLAAGISSACSSPPPTADAFVASYIEQGAAGGSCPYASRLAWVNVGTATGLQPTTVADGNSNGGGTVSVSCSVHPNGSGFDVQANVAQTGAGSITIQSNSPVTVSGGGKGVSGTFGSEQKGRYSSNDCTIAYTYNNAKVPNMTPVAAGRIWAHLSCPGAQRSDLNVMGPDGGTSPATCDTEADFIFENCAQ